MSNGDDCLGFTVSGFDDSLEEFIGQAFDIFGNGADEDQLWKIYDTKYKLWSEAKRNFYYSDPYMQVISSLSDLMMNKGYSPEAQVEQGMSFDEFYEWWRSFIQGGKMEWFISGNISE